MKDAARGEGAAVGAVLGLWPGGAAVLAVPAVPVEGVVAKESVMSKPNPSEATSRARALLDKLHRRAEKYGCECDVDYPSPADLPDWKLCFACLADRTVLENSKELARIETLETALREMVRWFGAYPEFKPNPERISEVVAAIDQARAALAAEEPSQ